jgi:hypothetical protein
MPKPKTCKVCKTKFEPARPLQMVCSPACSYEYAYQLKLKKDKAETKKAKESLLTQKDYLKMAQIVFNAYVRKRDEGKGCISCGTSLKGRKYDAGHLFTVGAFPNLRFYEDNVHGQCVPCNQHKHGNVAEYMIRLEKRIGKERFEKLLSLRNTPAKYTIDELKILIKNYKQKIKDYEN